MNCKWGSGCGQQRYQTLRLFSPDLGRGKQASIIRGCSQRSQRKAGHWVGLPHMDVHVACFGRIVVPEPSVHQGRFGLRSRSHEFSLPGHTCRDYPLPVVGGNGTVFTEPSLL